MTETDKFPGTNLSYKGVILLLIERKQLEFVGGGMVEHDEALVTYESIINSITGTHCLILRLDGHLYLNKNFNYTVKTAWQVDTFGHSKLTPYIMKDLGFDNLIINRVDVRLKRENNFEFVWNGMFTHLLRNHYSNHDIDWEVKGAIDIKERVQVFLKDVVEIQKSLVNKNEILYIWGDDMRFERASDAYSTMDSFMMEVNQKTSQHGFHVKYSRVSDYFAKLDKTRYPTLDNVDFFPYIDFYPFDVWTGYYSLRPHIKKLTRESDALQRSAEQLSSITDLDPKPLKRARLLNSLFQHHDAITGTHNDRTHVDYLKKYANHTKIAQNIIQQSICSILSKKDNCKKDLFLKKHVLSFHHVKSRVLVLYNPLPWKRSEYVKIQVLEPNVEVRNDNDQVIPSQISKRDEEGTYEVLFMVEIPAMGLIVYSLNKRQIRSDLVQSTQDLTIRQDDLKFHFRQDDFSSSYYSMNGTLFTFSQRYMSYLSISQKIFGNGQYIFRVNWGVNFLIGLGIGFVIGFILMVPMWKRVLGIYNRMYSLTITLFLCFWILHLLFVVFSDDLQIWATTSLFNFGLPFGMFVSSMLIFIGGFKNFFVFFVVGLISLAFFNFGHPEFMARPIDVKEAQGVALNGPYMSFFTQKMNGFTQITSLYKGKPYFDVQYKNIHSKCDFITRIELDRYSSHFSTDSNGFLMMPRDFQSMRFLQTNYYPVSSRMDLDDKLTVFPSHSLGATRFKKFVEFMIYRNQIVDDERGLDVPIFDRNPADTTLRFHLDSSSKFKTQLEVNHPILVYDVHPRYDFTTWKANFETLWSSIDPKYQNVFGKEEIDFTVQYKQGKHVIRFYNPNQRSLQVDLEHLFAKTLIHDIQQTNLNLLFPRFAQHTIQLKRYFATYTFQMQEHQEN